MACCKVTADEFLCKQPGETRQFSMDFAALLGTGETIEASSPAPSVESSPTGLTIDSVSVSGTEVLMDIAGGTHGIDYRVEVTITTSDGNILEGDGKLGVRDK